MIALSIRQPWAALLVHGLKTIEVRTWPTSQRGQILIHAGRLCDERKEAQSQVTPELESATLLRGGIVGAATLVECISYHDEETFARDIVRHHNNPKWYDWKRGQVLYGFRFVEPVVLPFRSYRGQTFFFRVKDHNTTPRVVGIQNE